MFTKNYTTQRKKMVQTQIEARGIRTPHVLTAMQKVERHLFVQPHLRTQAYQDTALPIDAQQTISQPYIVALMTELLELTPQSKVLEIGTGCGYQTAILAELAESVYSIEIRPELSQQAAARLRTLNYTNIHFRNGDGTHGWQAHAPYDAILAAAAPPKVPEPLLHQLQPGGRLVIPVGQTEQNLLLIKKQKNATPTFKTTKITPVRFVPMIKGDKH